MDLIGWLISLTTMLAYGMVQTVALQMITPLTHHMDTHAVEVIHLKIPTYP
jgi:hypothetical protein